MVKFWKTMTLKSNHPSNSESTYIYILIVSLIGWNRNRTPHQTHVSGPEKARPEISSLDVDLDLVKNVSGPANKRPEWLSGGGHELIISWTHWWSRPAFRAVPKKVQPDHFRMTASLICLIRTTKNCLVLSMIVAYSMENVAIKFNANQSDAIFCTFM